MCIPVGESRCWPQACPPFGFLNNGDSKFLGLQVAPGTFETFLFRVKISVSRFKKVFSLESLWHVTESRAVMQCHVCFQMGWNDKERWAEGEAESLGRCQGGVTAPLLCLPHLVLQLEAHFPFLRDWCIRGSAQQYLSPCWVLCTGYLVIFSLLFRDILFSFSVSCSCNKPSFDSSVVGFFCVSHST